MPEILIKKDQLDKIVNKVLSLASPELLSSIDNKLTSLIPQITDQVRQRIPIPVNGQDGKDAEITEELISQITVRVLERTNELIQVKNGKDGVDGLPGKDGTPGKDGQDGKNYVITEKDYQNIIDRIPKAERGEKGDRGEPGRNYLLTKFDYDEIAGLVEPKIRVPKDGKDYVLTDSDKRFIASLIPVPKDGIDGKNPDIKEILDNIKIADYVLKTDLDKIFKQFKQDLALGRVELPQRIVGGGGMTPKQIVDSINKYGPNLNYINLTKDATEQPTGEGIITWNDEDITANIDTGLGVSIQIGQEFLFYVYNGSGEDISNGQTVYPVEFFNGRASVAKANASTHVKITGAVALATMDIPNGTYGFVTDKGKVRGIDTSMYTTDKRLWVGATDGTLTNIKPEFPNYAIQIGGASVVDAVNGEITVRIAGQPEQTIVNFWNGIFRESFNFAVASDGSTVTGSLSPANGHPDMTMIFSDGFTMLTTTPSATITLTPGTDSSPQQNFIYVPVSTKELTLSTSGWPSTEHIKVATVVLRSAATTQTDGALKNHNWNDHIESTLTNQGHLSHIGERIRILDAKWDTGVLASVSGTPSNIYVATTAGIVYQMHRQTFPAQTMPTSDIHVVNHPVNPYVTTTNLNTQTVDANNVTLVNRSYSLVIWGVQNKTGEMSHLMCNLPSGSYTRLAPQDAVNDSLNYSIYAIPKIFDGTGFLIARLTFQLDAGGTQFTLYDNQDLRGYIPNTTAGGGAGSSGITEFTGLTDTPSSYSGFAGKFPSVNSGETALEFLTLKTGTLASPPTGMFNGEFWLDTTDSGVHPQLRMSTTTT